MPLGIDCSLVSLCIGLSLNDAVTMFKVEDIRKTLQCDAGEKEVFVLMGIDRDRRSSISPYKSFASTETSRNSSPVINVFGIR